MIKYYPLIPSDPTLSQFALFALPRNGPLQAKPKYSQFVCPSCGKLAELEALRSGVSLRLRKNYARDFNETADSCVVVSSAVRAIFETCNVKTVEYVETTGGQPFYILVPHVTVSFSDTAELRRSFLRCEQCGRHRESKGVPSPLNWRLPDRVATVAMSGETFESTWWQPIWFASEDVYDALKSADVKGLDWLSCENMVGWS